MAYQIPRTDQINYGSITVNDGTVNQETDLGFSGRNTTNYGQIIAENFLHLLENFAKSDPPPRPIIGQLWYDTDSNNNPSQPQLKVNIDGGTGPTSWAPAGSVIKRNVRPTTAVIGDIWVDTSNQQLYIWSGSNWILVGPSFSEGSLSGTIVEPVIDTLDISHTVIKQIIGGQVVCIISSDTFIPKVIIDGFPEIKQGINISEKDFDLDGTVNNKLWGVADRASKLVVSGHPTGLDANNFLRSDVTNTTNFGINIRNNAGLTLGGDLNTRFFNTANGETIINNRTEGSSIFVRVNVGGNNNDTITVTGSNVGINNTNPVQALDVNGKIKVNQGIIVTDTTDSTNLSTGSVTTAGGLAVAKTLRVGTGANITGTITSNSILPSSNNSYDLGTETERFRTIYANTVGNIDGTTVFRGEFTGAFNGSVTGTATRLTSPTDFSLTGDVSSNTISFNGQQVGGVATFTTTLSPDVITQKEEVFNSLTNDEILVNRVGTGLKKLTKTTFLSNVATVPIGSLVQFAGTVLPNGYLLCDGAEVQISQYPELYAVIGNTYKGPEPYLGVATFRLPDLRGRFALGRDNMNNGIAVPLLPDGLTSGTTIAASADRVTAITADEVGLSNGFEEREIAVTNLPEHTHNLTGNAGTQFYAPCDDTDGATEVTDSDAVARTASLMPGFSKFLTTAGDVVSAQTNVPMNVMNPYLTINYIIFTGRIV